MAVVRGRTYSGEVPAGRPKQFRREAALERAMLLFWRRGYESASLPALLKAMGISRQSLYDTFGSKRALYILAIEHYRATQISQSLALLSREGSPIENVKAALRFFPQRSVDSGCRGCLLANALVEVGARDPEIARLLGDTLELLRRGFESALRKAQARGELAAGKSPKQLSRALTTALMGMAVTGRLDRRRAELDGIYRTIFDRGVAYSDDRGEFAGFIGSCIDVEERVQAERARTTFLSLIAHELRTPLAAMKGFIEAIRRRVTQQRPVEPEIFGRLGEKVNRLADLVSELLDQSRLAEGRILPLSRVELDLSALTGEVIAFVAEAEASFRAIPGVDSVIRHDGRFTIRGRDESLVTRVIECVSERRIRVTDFRTELPNLEDVFLKLVTEEAAA